jgi:hypothetical protein
MSLRAALESSRFETLTKMGRSTASAAAATMSAAITHAAGAPLDVSASVALFGVHSGNMMSLRVEDADA